MGSGHQAINHNKVDKIANGIRRRVLEHTLTHNGGYLSQACSAAEILASLYSTLMKLGAPEAPRIPSPFAGVPGAGNPHAITGAGYNGPKAPDLDRFIMSPVHYALVLYATLVEVDRMGPEGLSQFNQDGSSVEMIGAEHSPGHEVTAGSLGQALGQAGGIALARKLQAESGRVWVFMSDGEFQSGQTWEALQALRFHQLDNIVAIVDVNRQQCDGAMLDVMNIEPLVDRVRSFGIQAMRIDGHDLNAISDIARLRPEKTPLIVLAYTNPCQGIPLLERRRPKLHFVRFKNAAERVEYQSFLDQQVASGSW